MVEHRFLFKEGLWKLSGEFFDGTGNRVEIEGQAAIRHYPDRWIYEGDLRTKTSPPQDSKNIYEIQPFAPGNFTTGWTSQSATLGTLRGRFLVLGDAILSSYESATGRYRGQDTILRREERHYSGRGALFDNGKLISAWAVELKLA
jgi:hypothetical protein